MMNKVTPLIRSVDKELIKKLFAKFSSVYGQLWSSRHKTDSDWVECCHTWLEGLKSFDFDTLRKAVVQSFSIHKEYPPTLGQLIDICLKLSGVPSEYQVIDLLMRRDFNHPLVKSLHDTIGAWVLSHGKPDEIKRLVQANYADLLLQYRNNPEAAWEKLALAKAISCDKPARSKIPSPSERMAFSERFKQWQEKAAKEKASLTPQTHPTWDESAVTMGHAYFDENMYNERRKYLCGLDETAAATLSLEEQYDRICFLRENLAHHYILSVKATLPITPVDKMQPRSNFGPKWAFKEWI